MKNRRKNIHLIIVTNTIPETVCEEDDYDYDYYANYTPVAECKPLCHFRGILDMKKFENL